MAIAPDSNRALSKDGAEPDFANSFDPCGNQILLQRGGQPLLYNRRNQLMRCTTVARAAPAASDHEQYVYAANGKRLRTIRTAQAKNTRVISQTRYLPGLELHEKTDQDLEVIVLDAAASPIRCLHWARGNPGIDDYQMRYSHGDHLGSSTLETDASGLLISRERFHPFGTTASWASRSAVEADYKTIRYSAKVMDASGLYYYGLRYYAPWLRHWIGPDPLGNVDGLNRYAMVGNNPVSFVDEQGAGKTRHSVSIQMPTSSPPSPISSSAQESLSRGYWVPGLSTPPVSPSAQESLSPGFWLPDPSTPPPMPSKSDETWQAWAKRKALALVNSRAGLSWLPEGATGAGNAAFVSLLGAGGSLAVYSMFNPQWSLASTWDPEGDGESPPANVTQSVYRRHLTEVLAITLATTLAGTFLSPLVGRSIDEFRRIQDRARANTLMDNIKKSIGQQSQNQNVTKKAQDSFREQTLEVEALIGITDRTTNLLHGIGLLILLNTSNVAPPGVSREVQRIAAIRAKYGNNARF
ncbi:RHS repeat domain-containing protein [Pseudomonas sp. NR3]|uniref:RHS repeat domain-containing protein n=1 Tax=Pseudomonas sp. NR3 TaxID=3155978 RepID=UPI003B67ACC1